MMCLLVNHQKWDKVIVLQVTSESQVFALHVQVKSQVKTGKSRVKLSPKQIISTLLIY